MFGVRFLSRSFPFKDVIFLSLVVVVVIVVDDDVVVAFFFFFNSSSLQFSSSVSACSGKSIRALHPSLRSVPRVAFKTVPVFV